MPNLLHQCLRKTILLVSHFIYLNLHILLDLTNNFRAKINNNY
jgi:hypothetical protein